MARSRKRPRFMPTLWVAWLLVCALLWPLPSPAIAEKLGFGAMEGFGFTPAPADGSYLVWDVPWDLERGALEAHLAKTLGRQPLLADSPDGMDDSYVLSTLEGLSFLGRPLVEVAFSFQDQLFRAAYLTLQPEDAGRLNEDNLQTLYLALQQLFAQEAQAEKSQILSLLRVGPLCYTLALGEDPQALANLAWAVAQFRAVCLSFFYENTRLDTVILLAKEGGPMEATPCFSAFAATLDAQPPENRLTLRDLRYPPTDEPAAAVPHTPEP